MLLFVVLVIVGYDFFLQISPLHAVTKRRYILICAGTLLFLYAALRGASVGTDTAGYIARYLSYAQYNFYSFWSILGELKDPGYQLSAWVFSKVFPDAQWWLAAVAAIYIIAVFRFINKYSPYPIFSILAFLALSYFSFSLSGLRQTVAMALSLFSIDFIEKKKPIKFVALIVAAALCHTSAVIFLMAYPLSRIRIGYKHLLAFLVTGVMIFSFQTYVRMAIAIIFDENRLAGYAEREMGLTASGFIIQLSIFLFCLFYYLGMEKKSASVTMLINFSFLGLIFQMYATMIAEFFRVSMYFSIANIVLIPICMALERREKTREIEMVMMLAILVAFLFRDGIPEYVFFWNGI